MTKKRNCFKNFFFPPQFYSSSHLQCFFLAHVGFVIIFKTWAELLKPFPNDKWTSSKRTDWKCFFLTTLWPTRLQETENFFPTGPIKETELQSNEKPALQTKDTLRWNICLASRFIHQCRIKKPLHKHIYTSRQSITGWICLQICFLNFVNGPFSWLNLAIFKHILFFNHMSESSEDSTISFKAYSFHFCYLQSDLQTETQCRHIWMACF